MHIPNLDSLPDVDTRAAWARTLDVNATTLYRAERKDHLKGQRTASGTVIYTKRAILEWLGFTFEPAKIFKAREAVAALGEKKTKIKPVEVAAP